jgi:hypothetical protein
MRAAVLTFVFFLFVESKLTVLAPHPWAGRYPLYMFSAFGLQHMNSTPGVALRLVQDIAHYEAFCSGNQTILRAAYSGAVVGSVACWR